MGFGVLLQNRRNTSTVGNANDYCSKNNPDKVLSSFSILEHYAGGAAVPSSGIHGIVAGRGTSEWWWFEGRGRGVALIDL